MVDYRSLSADELLTALEQAGRTPDLDLIRACLKRREELTPDLLKMLAGGVDENWEPDDPRWYREVHAGRAKAAQHASTSQPVPTPAVSTISYSQPAQSKQRTKSKKVGHNDPCPCGSGRKYRHCCGKRR